jgi:four helix bundle protein
VLCNASRDLCEDVAQLVIELKAKNESSISVHVEKSAARLCKSVAKIDGAKKRKDLIERLETALRDATETGIWVNILWKTLYIDEKRYKGLDHKCSLIRFLLTKSIRAAKGEVPPQASTERLKNKTIIHRRSISGER